MNDGLRQRFARVLRQVRHNNAMSQAEVAERIGIAVEAYGRLERGAVLPRAETLIGLAYAFNVSTDELLGVKLDHPKHAPAVAQDPVGSRSDPDWRRLLAVLDQLSPRSLRALANTLRSIRDEAVETAESPHRR